jgi:4-hydroxy-4-methyl-2-oxoglutarate aldolase
MTDERWRARLTALDTGLVSDALDRLGLAGATYGIRPIWPCPKIVGRVMTVRTRPAGRTTSQHHLAMPAIAQANAGDVILVDNGGRLDVSGWGDILSTAARMRGLSGAVIDGACRDVDGSAAVGFPVYARGAVPMTARGRIVEESWGQPVQCRGVAVHPGDVLIADGSGVVLIPQDRLDEVLAAAENLAAREQAMLEAIRAGAPLLEIDQRHAYEQMLRPSPEEASG